MTIQPNQNFAQSPCLAFACEMRRLREKKGIAQHELARRLNVKQPYLSSIERVRKPAPSRPLIDRICAALGLSESEADAFSSFAAIARDHWKHELQQRSAVNAVPRGKPTHIEILINGVSLIRIQVPNRAALIVATGTED